MSASPCFLFYFFIALICFVFFRVTWGRWSQSHQPWGEGGVQPTHFTSPFATYRQTVHTHTLVSSDWTIDLVLCCFWTEGGNQSLHRCVCKFVKIQTFTFLCLYSCCLWQLMDFTQICFRYCNRTTAIVVRTILVYHQRLGLSGLSSQNSFCVSTTSVGTAAAGRWNTLAMLKHAILFCNWIDRDKVM